MRLYNVYSHINASMHSQWPYVQFLTFIKYKHDIHTTPILQWGVWTISTDIIVTIIGVWVSNVNTTLYILSYHAPIRLYKQYFSVYLSDRNMISILLLLIRASPWKNWLWSKVWTFLVPTAMVVWKSIGVIVTYSAAVFNKSVASLSNKWWYC